MSLLAAGPRRAGPARHYARAGYGADTVGRGEFHRQELIPIIKLLLHYYRDKLGLLLCSSSLVYFSD